MAVKKTLGARSDHQADLMAPMGREFGSPDYECLDDLDHLVTKVHKAFLGPAAGWIRQARHWAARPTKRWPARQMGKPG